MLAYCVDQDGGCRAVQYPTQAHLVQMLRAVQLDHVLYYPVDNPCFVVYFHPGSDTGSADASPRGRIGTVYIVPLVGGTPSTADLARLYAWCLRWHRTHGYPFLTVAALPPAPNQSNNDAAAVRSWCDTQIDAFTFWMLASSETLLAKRHDPSRRERVLLPPPPPPPPRRTTSRLPPHRTPMAAWGDRRTTGTPIPASLRHRTPGAGAN